MRILWLHVEDFKCFGNMHLPDEGTLPKGLLIIEGPNSAGKSSLFDAIYYALFYDPQRDKYLGTKDDLIRRGKQKTSVELAFELNNRYYLVQKEHGKKSAVNAKLFELDPSAAEEGEGKIINSICQGLTDVNNKISELLNIDRQKALNTLIVRQGEVHQLAEAKGSELRDIIYTLFQLDYYKERVGQVISFKIDQIEDKIEQNKIMRTTEDIQAEIDDTELRIKETEEEIEKTRHTLKELEKEIKELPDLNQLQKVQDINAKINQLKNEKKRTENDLKSKAEYLKLPYPITAEAINNRINEIENSIKQLETKKQEIEEKKNTVLAIKTRLKNDLETLERRKESLQRILKGENQTVKCEVCSQDIDRNLATELLEKADKNIPTINNGINKREKEYNQLVKESKEIEQQILSLRQTKVNISNLVEWQKRVEQHIKNIQSFEKELHKELSNFGVTSLTDLAKKYGLQDYRQLYEKINTLNMTKTQQENNLEHYQRDIDEKKKRIEKLKKDIIANQEKEKKIEKLLQEKDLYNEVKKYVEGFIAEDIVVNKLLAGIQESTSTKIYHFTGGQYNELYLEPTKQKTLIMSIKDERDGFVKNQQFLSGGDKSAIGLGLRIGICELLKRVRPMKSSPMIMPRLDILMLDEPLAALDEKRRKQVVEGLKSSEFSQIFLITHTDVKNKANAPLIQIEPGKTGSKARYFPVASETEMEA